MRIALAGYGRMGREVEQVALARKHEVGPVFTDEEPVTASKLEGAADVLIDFSGAAAVPAILRDAAEAEVPLVEGTTGWQLAILEKERSPSLTLVHSPNFSMGVYQFEQLLRRAAELLREVGAYDVYLHEFHHRAKADSPSGTARKLAALLVETLPGKETVREGNGAGPLESRELHVSSTRAGHIPGTHEVGFDSEVDRIVLRHEALGRAGFALGAVRAAEWIVNQPPGVYSMSDFMEGARKVGIS